VTVIGFYKLDMIYVVFDCRGSRNRNRYLTGLMLRSSRLSITTKCLFSDMELAFRKGRLDYRV